MGCNPLERQFPGAVHTLCLTRLMRAVVAALAEHLRTLVHKFDPPEARAKRRESQVA